MRKPIQSAPVQKFSGFHAGTPAAISPSDCPNGNIQIWFPDGTTTTVNSVVGCCYSYPDCDVCNSSPGAWDGWIGQHFYPQCGDNNANQCLYNTYCVGI